MLSETCVILVQLAIYINQLEQTVQQLQRQLQLSQEELAEAKAKPVAKTRKRV